MYKIYPSLLDPKIVLVKYIEEGSIKEVRIPEELIAKGFFVRAKFTAEFIKDIKSIFNINLEDKDLYKLVRV